MTPNNLRRGLALVTVLLGLSCSFLFPPVDEGVLTLRPLGGQFTFGPVTVTVPPYAVTTEHTVSIGEATGTPASPGRVGAAVTVTLTPPDTLLVPATVQFRYADFTSPPRVPRGTLLLHHVENGSWVPVGGTNDAATSVVSAEVTHLGDFALLGRRAETVEAQSATTQPAQPNAPLAIPPSVIVRDSAGAALAGVPVTFAVIAGGGSISPATAVTDASGIASAASWSGGPVANGNAATATVTELLPVSFTTTAAAGAPVPSSTALNAGNSQTATVGSSVAIRPSVVVRDQNNTPFVGAAVAFSVTSGGGSVIGASQTTGADGIATVGAWTLGSTAGTNTLTARVTGTGITGNPVTFTATALAGTAGRLVVNSGDGQLGTVGTPVATAPSVLVLDQSNNPVAGATVLFSVGIGGGTLTGATQTTGPSGIAAVGSWTLGGVAGLQTLTATVSATGFAGSPVTVSATAQAAAASAIAERGGLGQSAVLNTTVAVPPSVRVTDQYGNPVRGVTVTFAVTGGGGSITGGTAVTGWDGVAQVGSWTLGPSAGVNTLAATSTGLTGSPVIFTANAIGTAASVGVNNGDLQTATAGTAVAIPPSVRVVDQAGNPVQGTAVTFAVTGGGGSVLGESQTTGSDGVARLARWTLGAVPGPNTLTATNQGLAGSPVTFTATGTPPPAATSIALNDGDGQSAAVGTAVATPPSVIVRDQYNNPFPGLSVTFAATAGGGSVTGTAQTSGSNGVARVGSWTLGPTAGTNTLAATTAGLIGSPVSFTATAIVAPPPPPPGPDEPTDPGSGYLWADNFDRYASPTAMMACPPNAYTTQAPYFTSTVPNHASCSQSAASKYQLTTGRGGTGNALRSVYDPDPGHLQQSLAWLSPWWGTPIAFGSSIVIQFWMRIGNGQSYAPLGGKFFEAVWISGASGRIQWANDGNTWHSVLGANPGGSVNRTIQPVGPYWSSLNDGVTWHRVTLLFKANTSSTYSNTSGITSATETYSGTSSRDGRVALWVDGTRVLDYSQATVGVTPPGGTGPWCRQGDVDMIPGLSGTNTITGVGFFRFPEVANGTDGGITIDHDDLKIWRGQ
jgi:adhesin/invasin